jgi:hypothetical protein
MDSTVQPERKLAVATLATPRESSTGLMMTPPIPQMPPMIEGRKLMQKYYSFAQSRNHALQMVEM